MGIGLPVLLFTASVYTVAVDGVALRKSCAPGEAGAAKLERGDPVTIRYAMHGEYGACYKVAVESGGRKLEGWLAPGDLKGLEAFDEARRAAQSLDAPQAARRDMASVREQVAGKVRFQTVDARVLEASRLLEGGQPEEALQKAEAALGLRRDPGVLALAGVAAFQSDRPRAAAEYFEASLAMEPNEAVERMLARARREAREDQSSEKLYGARFVLRYNPKELTADQARPLVPVLDQEFARVSEALGCRAEERIVAVLQGLEAYRRTTGAAEWSGGGYDGRIRVALLERQPGAHTRRVFAHEIVHACLARTGDWPAWLHEGLAQKLSGEVLGEKDREAVGRLAKSGELPGLAQLSKSWTNLSSENAAMAYAVAHAAADHLYAAYGADGVRSLMQSPERLGQVAAELDRRLRQ